MREFFAWGTHQAYSNIYSETRNAKIAKSPKIRNVFNPHKSFPGRQQLFFRVTQKPGNSSVLSRKTKNPFEPKICLCKDV